MKNRKSIARLKSTLRKKYSLKNKKNKSKNSRVKKGTRKNSIKKMNKKSSRNSRRTKGRRHNRKYKGGSGSGGIPFSGLPYPAGYAQYSNNNPNTPSYSLGGDLKASDSALANPVPLTKTNNCVDNYDHYTNKGFASRGH